MMSYLFLQAITVALLVSLSQGQPSDSFSNKDDAEFIEDGFVYMETYLVGSGSGDDSINVTTATPPGSTTTTEVSTISNATTTTPPGNTITTTEVSTISNSTDDGQTTTTTTTTATTTTTSTTSTTTTSTTSTTTSTTSTTTTSTTSTTTSITTTIDSTTETDSGVCPSGYFGLNCTYRCYCRNPSDICDPVFGNCSSGCPTGWYGPGCLADERPGLTAIVLILILLLILTLILCLVLLYHLVQIFNQKEKQRKRSSLRAARKSVFELSSLKLSDQGTLKLQENIPTIKKTNIELLESVLHQGYMWDIKKGFINALSNKTEVIFRSLQGFMSQEDQLYFESYLKLNTSVGQYENIIKFYGVSVVIDQIHAAFEYASNGDLQTFLRKNVESTSFPLTSQTSQLHVAADVANGMVYLSRKEIYHGKLCAQNILLDSKFTAKISGIKPRGRMPEIVRWTAPEVIHNRKYSTQCDVWSFGVLLWEIVTFCDIPYSDVSTADDLHSLLKTGYRLPQPEGVNDDVYNVMRLCWHGNPQEIPMFSTLLTMLQEMVLLAKDQEVTDSDEVQYDSDDNDDGDDNEEHDEDGGISSED